MSRPRSVAAAVLALALVILAWLPQPQHIALETAEAGLKRALATYAVARGLDALVSAAQGTQVSAAPAGMGVITAPGQLLDPANDLLEQFSSLMLTAIVAFGLQVLLLQVGAHWVLSLSFTAAVVLAGMSWWRRRRVPPVWTRVLLVLAVARFAVLGCTFASDWLYRGYLAERYTVAQQQIDKASDMLRRRDIDVRQLPEQLTQAAELIVRQVVDLIVVFLVHTVIFPVVTLWFVVAMGRALVAGTVPRGAPAAGPPD
ncbi:hypothetical protein [Piscinibacter sp. XHJ-5]|uniref:hypothetical protein n=1 Tax=Piscinibacter sp. XHJ-5 TaxID=3037797 RepID=UPI002453729C|nr:hypothetical protein [Piscinibacter sp. XHJ-5]